MHSINKKRQKQKHASRILQSWPLSLKHFCEKAKESKDKLSVGKFKSPGNLGQAYIQLTRACLASQNESQNPSFPEEFPWRVEDDNHSCTSAVTWRNKNFFVTLNFVSWKGLIFSCYMSHRMIVLFFTADWFVLRAASDVKSRDDWETIKRPNLCFPQPAPPSELPMFITASGLLVLKLGCHPWALNFFPPPFLLLLFFTLSLPHPNTKYSLSLLLEDSHLFDYFASYRHHPHPNPHHFISGILQDFLGGGGGAALAFVAVRGFSPAVASPLFSCSIGTSHCGGSPCCRAWAVECTGSRAVA